EVTALVHFVVVDQVGIGLLDPVAWHLHVLTREDGDSCWQRNVDGGDTGMVFPIEPRRGSSGVGEPVERDVVKGIVACDSAEGLPGKEIGEFRVTEGVMVNQPGGKTDW